MNHIIKIPFTKIVLRGCDEKHINFFKELFFNSKNQKTVTELTIYVNFKDLRKNGNSYLVENNALSNNDNFFILDTKSNKAQINFHEFNSKEINITIEKAFDLYFLFTYIIEPLTIIWSCNKKILFIHSSGIVKNNDAIVFPAWRNTGKTNTILNLCRNGYKFLGDDYCVIKNRQCYLYPKTLNIFSYNLMAFPNVLNNFTKILAYRLRFTILTKNILYYFSQITNGSISKIFFRISELAEISTNIKINPSIIGIDTEDYAKLNKTILIIKSSSNSINKKEINHKLLLNKIKTTILYELKDFFEIYNKYQYLFPDKKIKIIDKFENNYLTLLNNEILSTELLTINKQADIKEYL